MDKLRRALSGNDTNEDDEVGIVSQVIFCHEINIVIQSSSKISEATSLSFKNRVIAFGVCFGIGLLFSIIVSFTSTTSH